MYVYINLYQICYAITNAANNVTTRIKFDQLKFKLFFHIFSKGFGKEYCQYPIAKSPAVDDRLQGDSNDTVVVYTYFVVDPDERCHLSMPPRYEGLIAKEVF